MFLVIDGEMMVRIWSKNDTELNPAQVTSKTNPFITCSSSLEPLRTHGTKLKT
jgi:hypothetical protein